MVILSSPSGAGKTTLVKILADRNNFNISISHTTRKPRPKEIDAQDYYFVNENDFKSLVSKNEFLEYAKVFNNYYGTTKTPVIKNLENGQNVIFDIDSQGTDQIKNKKLKYKLITFFILPPSKKILFDRLLNRHMNDKLIVEERIREFSKDILHWKEYDYVVINDDLEKCYQEINKLIESSINNSKNNYNIKFIQNHIDKLTI